MSGKNQPPINCPLPWRAYEPAICDDNGEVVVHETCSDEAVTYIVQACNAYPKLIDFVRQISRDGQSRFGQQATQLLEELRQYIHENLMKDFSSKILTHYTVNTGDLSEIDRSQLDPRFFDAYWPAVQAQAGMLALRPGFSCYFEVTGDLSHGPIMFSFERDRVAILAYMVAPEESSVQSAREKALELFSAWFPDRTVPKMKAEGDASLCSPLLIRVVSPALYEYPAESFMYLDQIEKVIAWLLIDHRRTYYN
jgi:hypothetical protein